MYGKAFRKWLKSSVWTFPVIVLLFFCVLVSFKISGTSEGIYHKILYGASAKDQDLIYNHPQTIRSDEWLVETQLTISQSRLGFPRYNPDIANGQDLSLNADLPAKDWGNIFKPQLWTFFVLPLEYAFAIKWWFVMFLLMVSCYFFILRVLPGKKLFASTIALAIGLSPFELWWYQSTGFLPLAYGFLMIILVMRIINREPVKFVANQRASDILHTAALVFIGVCFGLIFYPPFQIPVAIALLFFVIGYFLQKYFDRDDSFKSLLKRLSLLVLAGLATVTIGLTFYETHKTPIKTLNSSIYPGNRRTVSGGMRTLQVFDSFVMPLEQSAVRGSHFFTNQSEAANFILLLPFLVVPGFALMWLEWKQKRKIDWLFLALQGTALLFFVRAFTHHFNFIGRLLLLDRVPNNARLLIGIGFLGIIQLIYLVKKLDEVKIPKKHLNLAAFLYGLGCFAVLLWTGSFIRERYPMFLSNIYLLIGLAAAFTSIIVAFILNKKLIAAGLFLLFTLASVYKVMPLYRGLGVPDHSQVITAMDAISKPTDAWVTVGDDASLFENFGLDAGRPSISGTQVYPNLNFWSQLGAQYASIYNREGHAFFTDDPSQAQPIVLTQTDAFKVKFQCSNFIEKNARFALSVHPLKFSCVHLVDTVKYPATTFYMYKITQ